VVAKIYTPLYYKLYKKKIKPEQIKYEFDSRTAVLEISHMFVLIIKNTDI